MMEDLERTESTNDDDAAPLNGFCEDEVQPDLQKVCTFDEYQFVDEDDQDKSTKGHKHKSTRVAWNAVEIREIEKYFEVNINAAITPGRKECMKAIEMSQKTMDLYTKEIGRQLRKKCGTLFRKQNYKPLQQCHVKVSLRPNKV